MYLLYTNLKSYVVEKLGTKKKSEVGVLTKPEGKCGNLLYGSGINIDPGCKLNIIKISTESLNQI